VKVHNFTTLGGHNHLMSKIVVCHARKGGVGKSMLAYELAWMLGAPLIDLEWDDGCVSRQWGYRYEDRGSSPLLTALEKGTVPRLLKGYNKPDVLPGHPDLAVSQPSEDDMADAILKWAGEWGREWVVIDSHPGASPSAHGALSVANVVIAPTTLRTYDLNACEGMVKEMSDYPLVLVPNMVPRVPPAAEIERLRRMVDGTPIQVAGPIPLATAVGTRKKRVAMTSENPPAKAIQPVVSALQGLADFVRAYANE
jgi:chromosome partitioning protein